MTSDHQETDAEFGAFLAGVDRALTAQFGPDHQGILSGTPADVVRAFHWNGSSLKRIDPG